MIDLDALAAIRRAKIPAGCEALSLCPVGPPPSRAVQADDDGPPPRRPRWSAYRGVSWYPQVRRWRARLYLPGGLGVRYAGYHADEVDAARAYDRLAREHLGADATLNFPEEHQP